jgi:radical SAM superfamily enzyme YgiQ (UPF0313 family)
MIAADVADHDVRILDMRIENKLEETLADFDPHIVGVGSLITEVNKSKDVLEKAKKYNNDILTVVGGHHATVAPGDFNEDFIDIIVLGNGEVIFSELVRAYETGKGFDQVSGLAIPGKDKPRFTGERAIPTDLKNIKFPVRSLTEKYRGKYFRADWRPVASMLTSRGCPYRCNFCSQWAIMKGKYLARSPVSIVEELSQINEKYIDFVDDNTLHDIKRAERICTLIKEQGIKKTYKLLGRSDKIAGNPHIIEKWKEIGMELILIGLESFRDGDLEKMHKFNTVNHNEEAIGVLHQNDVGIVAYFIIDPGYEKEDFEILTDYIYKMDLHYPIFTILTPLPGTLLYEERKGELLTNNYEYYDFMHSVLPTKLPADEFYTYFVDLYRTFYGSTSSKWISLPEHAFEKMYAKLQGAVASGFAEGIKKTNKS